MYENYRQKDFFWGAFIGGAIASLTTLLFTTKKGKQLQRQIVDTYEEVEGAVKDTFAHAKEKAEDTAEEAGKKIAHKVKPHEHPSK